MQTLFEDFETDLRILFFLQLLTNLGTISHVDHHRSPWFVQERTHHAIISRILKLFQQSVSFAGFFCVTLKKLVYSSSSWHWLFGFFRTPLSLLTNHLWIFLRGNSQRGCYIDLSCNPNNREGHIKLDLLKQEKKHIKNRKAWVWKFSWHLSLIFLYSIGHTTATVSTEEFHHVTEDEFETMRFKVISFLSSQKRIFQVF